MDEKRRAELAGQVEDAFDRLQRLNIQATPDNVGVLDAVYGLLRYVYQGLTEKEAEAEDVSD